MLHIQRKFWKHVEERLNNIEDTCAYFAGGTLSIPLGMNKKGKGIGICLNLSGKGFVLSNLKNTQVYMPDYITQLVQEIYLKYKGKTEHYIEVTENG
jgi:hypothetical protein